jgi:hypothetical protein
MNRIGRAQQRAGTTLALARWVVEANRLIRRANARWERICNDKGWGFEALSTRADFHHGVRFRLPADLKPVISHPTQPERDVSLAYAVRPEAVRRIANMYLFERYECAAVLRQNGTGA